MTDTAKPTDTTQYSVPVVWSDVYSRLKSGDWDEDVDEVIGDEEDEVAVAARTLKYVHTAVDSDEDGVLAVLRAAHKHHNRIFLSPVEVAEMADGLIVGFPDFDVPLTQHLDENYDGLNPDWLNERGRKGMEDEIKKSSEIWIDDDNLPGVWVFTKPGHTV